MTPPAPRAKSARVSERPESLSDTIVACATAAGPSALAVVRLAGPEARRVAGVSAPARRQRASHRLCAADVRNASGALLDRGMVVEMHAPRSYTGDDVVELHLRGWRPVSDGVIERASGLGARLARPGEFTLRA